MGSVKTRSSRKPSHEISLPNRVICFLNQKGGVGKTTLALNIAARFALAGQAVLYVDADPQANALDWSAVRQQQAQEKADRLQQQVGPPLFNVVSMPRNTLHTQLPTLGASYAWTFIDGPPLAGDVAKSAMLASDLIVVPVQPSGADKWSTKKILDLISEAQFYKPHLKAVITVNRKIVSTVIGKHFGEEFQADYPSFPVMHTEIGQYVAFAEALTTGTTVLEMEPKGHAARQICELVDELKETLNHDQENQGPRQATAH
jgi:chromosome partitioning protein